MTLDERWNIWYQEVVVFIEKNHRNPLWYMIWEHDMQNWNKVNRKTLNTRNLKEERGRKLGKLLALMEEN